MSELQTDVETFILKSAERMYGGSWSLKKTGRAEYTLANTEGQELVFNKGSKERLITKVTFTEGENV